MFISIYILFLFKVSRLPFAVMVGVLSLGRVEVIALLQIHVLLCPKPL